MLEPGDVLDRHYQIEKTLALGGAGLTYRVKELDPQGQPHGPDLAVKVLYAQRDQGSFLQRLSNEAQILQQLAHPNIVECRGFVHRSGHAPYLVTLFEHGGSLGDVLEEHVTLSPTVSAGVLRQVLLALDKAHERGIIHRDLKPENVLLRERVPPDQIPEVRVADFGIAKVDALGGKLTRQGAFVGTPEFAAPEQFEGLPPTPATDIYAAGALFYTLLTGRDLLAFTDRLDTIRCLEELVRTLPPAAPEDIGTPEERALIQEIFSGTLKVEPGSRWRAGRFLQALDGLIKGTAGPTLQDLRTLPAEGGAPPTSDLPAADPVIPDEELYGGTSSLSPALVGIGLPLLATVVGVPILAIVLAGIAWSTGWFAGPPSPDQANLVSAVHALAPSGEATDLSDTSDSSRAAERDQLLGALANAARHLPGECRLRGPLSATVEISGSGRLISLNSEGLDATQRACAARVFRGNRLPRTRDDRVRLGLRLDLGS